MVLALVKPHIWAQPKNQSVIGRVKLPVYLFSVHKNALAYHFDYADAVTRLLH